MVKCSLFCKTRKIGTMKYVLLFILFPALVLAKPTISTEDRIANLTSKAEESCADYGGILELSGDEITQYDFDQDGEIDLTILNEIEYICPTALSLFAGNGGQIFHFMTDIDYAREFARSFEVIDAFHGVSVILLTEHGSSCGTFGFITCVRAITIHEGNFLKPVNF